MGWGSSLRVCEGPPSTLAHSSAGGGLGLLLPSSAVQALCLPVLSPGFLPQAAGLRPEPGSASPVDSGFSPNYALLPLLP